MTQNNDWEEEKITFLKGLPELKVFRISQRVHTAGECPAGGNCLNEKEALELIQGVFLDVIFQTKQDTVKEVIG